MNHRGRALQTLSAGLLAAAIINFGGAAGNDALSSSSAVTAAGSVSRAGSSGQSADSDPPSLSVRGDERAWKFIVLHHSASVSGSVESIDAAHRARRDSHGRPWRGIGYHFVIGNGQGMSDGEVEPTFRWIEQSAGAHAGVGEFNELGVGICLIGNFEEAPPTPAQLAAARSLIAALRARYGIAEADIVTHGDLKATACPGRFFSRELVTATGGPDSDP